MFPSKNIIINIYFTYFVILLYLHVCYITLRSVPCNSGDLASARMFGVSAARASGVSAAGMDVHTPRTSVSAICAQCKSASLTNAGTSTITCNKRINNNIIICKTPLKRNDSL